MARPLPGHCFFITDTLCTADNFAYLDAGTYGKVVFLFIG